MRQPNGFSTNISYRAERPTEKAVAEELQQSLAKVGIKLTINAVPAGRLREALRRQRWHYSKTPRPRPEGLRLGRRLAGRLRLPGADRRQPGDPRRAGNTNLGIKIPAVDALLDKAFATNDVTARNQIWGDIDQAVMENASALPGVWARACSTGPPTPDERVRQRRVRRVRLRRHGREQK